MKGVFALAIFVAAGLIFLIEPVMGKMLLPRLGGGPGVWNTCLMFFQATLLCGYVYAHLLSLVKRVWVQVAMHGAVLMAGLLLSPGRMSGAGWVATGDATAAPVLSAAWFLMGTVGVPFVALAATGPLLQRWFSRADAQRGADPYWLYAVSNAGSVIGLVAYPFVVEPWIGIADQLRWWGAGYGVLGAVSVVAGVMAARGAGATGAEAAGTAAKSADAVKQSSGWLRRVWWLALAAVPSSLLLGTTQHLTSDVAALPLLWMPPLLAYLATFIVAFTAKGERAGRVAGWVLPIAGIGAGVLAISDLREPIGVVVGVHILVLLSAGLACHGRLYGLRPSDPRELTGYYLIISLGGAIGGVFNTLVAPAVFTQIVEYPAVIVAACLLAGSARVRRGTMPLWGRVLVELAPAALAMAAIVSIEHGVLLKLPWAALHDNWLRMMLMWTVPGVIAALVIKRRWAAGLAIATMLAAPLMMSGVGRELLFAQRSWFGVHRVYRLGEGKEAMNELWHGRIIHGRQFVEPPLNKSPISYYFRGGPMAEVFMALYVRSAEKGQSKLESAAFIGLGTGTLVSYARDKMTVDYYEIDPVVRRIATDPVLFSYIQNARVKPNFVMGDARLTMAAKTERTGKNGYDLILVDAFSSDAIPTHLLTRECIAMYFSRLREDGLLVLHISNKYLDLEPVAAAAAKERGLVALFKNDRNVTDEMERLGKSASTVVVLARSEGALGELATKSGWRAAENRRGVRVWTDDYSNILGILK